MNSQSKIAKLKLAETLKNLYQIVIDFFNFFLYKTF